MKSLKKVLKSKLFYLVLLLGVLFIPIFKISLQAQEFETVDYSYKNLASPDLEGKEYLGEGVYFIKQYHGVTLTYNVYNGNYVLNGTPTSAIVAFYNMFNIASMNGTFSFVYVSGTSNLANIYWNAEMASNYLLRGIRDGASVNNEVVITETFKHLVFSDYSMTTYDNYTFKLQLEKGDTATPYTVPGQIPQYKIVGEE